MIKPTLTPKQEKFCQQIVEGKSQSDAYRRAFKPKSKKKKTIHEAASRVMAMSKVATRIKELMVPVVEKVRKTREELLDKFQAGGWFDPRQMFDTHGNPYDIPALKDHEAMMLDGFEIVEEFAGKGADRVPVGYTRKFKLADRHKYLTSYGKMMGFISEEGDRPEDGLMPPRVEVIFVDSPGTQVQVNVGHAPKPKPKVQFVG